ncbi:glycosyltransferase 61 family protein [Paraglaciecola marina]|uniref:glycosyltransferase 61 family protein n=1 Tax=Paraglaciecola marina TaxID=2500157 RepID=UPI00106117F7|nr:glycosyltransferase family 61 protein [Paraglaciecola marina]
MKGKLRNDTYWCFITLNILNSYNFLKRKHIDLPRKRNKNKFEKYVEVGDMVKELNDVYVMSPTGLILDSEFNPIYSTANEIIYWVGKPKRFPEQLKLHGRDYLRQKDVWLQRAKLHLESQIDHCKKNIVNCEYDALIYASSATEKLVFGHFYDMIQRLYQINLPEFQELKLLVSSPSRILDFERFLSLLGFKSGYVSRPKGPSLLKVKRLIVPEMSVGPAGMAEDVQAWLFDKLILSNSAVDKSGKNRINLYLDRSSVVRKNNRNFSNASEVDDFLKSRGFVSHRDFKTLDEVLNAYYNARIVIGGHGAAFINCIYCNQDTNIYEFVASNRLVSALSKMPKQTKEHWLFEMQANHNHSFDMDLNFLNGLFAGDINPASFNKS